MYAYWSLNCKKVRYISGFFCFVYVISLIFRWCTGAYDRCRSWRGTESGRQTSASEQRQTTHHVQGVGSGKVQKASRARSTTVINAVMIQFYLWLNSSFLYRFGIILFSYEFFKIEYIFDTGSSNKVKKLRQIILWFLNIFHSTSWLLSEESYNYFGLLLILIHLRQQEHIYWPTYIIL